MSQSRNQRRLIKKKGQDHSPILQGLHNEALTHYRNGRLADAEKIYRYILSIDPRNADSMHLLGVIAGDSGHPEAAIDLINQAIGLKKNVSAFHINLGNVFKTSGKEVEAIACYERALRLNPRDFVVLNNLGLSFHDQGDLEQAVMYFQRALALSPDTAEIHNNLGLALKNEGKLDKAMFHYNRAISLKPDYAEAHWNTGFVQLLTEDFVNGWRENEWRWRMPGTISPGLKTQPWDGGDLRGQTILLHGEQGLGDSIQFIRYAHLVKEKGGTVLLACCPPLARLFECVDGIDRIYSAGGVPAHDFHASLMSLPKIFGTNLESIPAIVPYLHKDNTLVNIWQDRLAGCSGFRVGITWRGNPNHKNDHNRSITIAQIAQYLTVPGLSVISLQKDAKDEELAVLRDLDSFFDAGSLVSDFADTGAIMANLDLVITVDTSICHLAGALAVPVWTLIPFAPDWRWMLKRIDSPWYPTMRLFRQERAGDWHSVMENVQSALLPRSD